MKEFREFMNMPEGSLFGVSHSRFGNCDSCMAKFGLLKRKHPCDQCGTNFCASCVRGRRCPRCRALAAGRPALLALRVRDLRALLRSRGLAPPLGAAEKTELVDLLLLGPASTERSGQQPEPTSRGRSEAPTPTASTSSRQRTPPSMPQWGGPFLPEEAYSDEEQEPHAGREGPFPAASTTRERTPPVMPQQGGPFVHQEEPSEEEQQEREPASPPRSPTVGAATGNSGGGGMEVETLLEQVQSEEQLGQLTVLQMKLMLTRNFIDYRGCCEKAELYERLRWLWNQKRKHQGEGVSEEDVCKICMEEGVDCVILDCGHMCTCTSCGKQLSECPICRQYVVRVVHVFRA